jgi:uncharacterized membrane protein
MASIVLPLLLIFLIPLAIKYSCRKIKLLGWLSPIVVCYLVGICAGNLCHIANNQQVMSAAAEVCVCLALPLLLFSSDFLKWIKHSKKTFVSFFLAITAVSLTSVAAFFIFKEHLPEAWKVAGMMVGDYTGGTANMTAIGVGLRAQNETFILINSADIIFSGIYFLFLITIAKKIFGLLLPRFRGFNGMSSAAPEFQPAEERGNVLKKMVPDYAASLILSSLLFISACGLSFLFFRKIMPMVVILTITTSGIALSFHPRVHNLKSNYRTGEYLLLVFAVAMGALSNFSELITSNLSIMLYCCIMVFGSALIHLVSASFFKIDDDTMIITSTAAIFGPAFIGPVAEGIRNKEVIVSGIAMGLLGNAMGNYLGLGIAYLLSVIH